MEVNNLEFCPVCGFPTHENDLFTSFGGTCPCCSFEFGVDESNYGDNPFVKYREKWVENGLKFMSPTENPDWNLEEAIANLKNLKSLDIKMYFLNDKVNNKEWTSYFDEDYIRRKWTN
jgi:hypothetical protein